MNNLDYWIPNCSPYISKLHYGIGKRRLTLECVNNIEDFTPDTRIVCDSVLSYSETTEDEEYDDDCIDGVMDISWNGVHKTLIILTDKKEIVLKLGVAPVSGKVT